MGSTLTRAVSTSVAGWKLRALRGLAIARRKAARVASRVLLGPVAGRVPHSSIASLDKFLYVPALRERVVHRETLLNAGIASVEYPSTFPAYFRRCAVYPPRYLYVISDACVSPFSGLAWIDDLILLESVGSLDRLMGWGGVLHEPLLPTTRLEGDRPVVACAVTGYFHWLLEALPNFLKVLERVASPIVLVPTEAPRYAVESLASLRDLGAPPFEILCCNTPMRVSKLIMAEVDETSGFPRPADLELLRSTFASAAPTPASAQPAPMIHISRRKARKRRLEGEAALEHALAGEGFTTIYAEDLGYAEQIRLFAGATNIVALHGAGLSNLVWCRSGCRVLEVFPPRYVNDCYAWLAAHRGLEYQYVSCGEDETTLTERTVSKVIEAARGSGHGEPGERAD